MGQLALGHSHGIAEELAFTCRSGKSASGGQRVGDKGIWIVAIAGSDGMSCSRCVAFVQGGDLASPVIGVDIVEMQYKMALESE